MPVALDHLTLKEIQNKLTAGETTSRALTEAYLARIEAVDARVGAFLTVLREGALTQADAADATRRCGADGPFLGVPVGIKDVLCTKGTRTTCGSRILDNFVPPY